MKKLKEIKRAEFKTRQGLDKKQLEDLQTAFNLFDTDGLGTINVSELKVALRALGFEPQKDEIKKLLNANEENGEKDPNVAYTIDFNEFISILEIKMMETETVEEVTKAYELFCGSDPSGISFDRLKEVALKLEENITDEELHQMIDEAKKGELDGKVTAEELKALLFQNK